MMLSLYGQARGDAFAAERSAERTEHAIVVVVADRQLRLGSELRVGPLEITLTDPPVALRPYSVPCGPRKTSTRSTSKKPGIAPAERDR